MADRVVEKHGFLSDQCDLRPRLEIVASRRSMPSHSTAPEARIVKTRKQLGERRFAAT